MTRHQAIGTLLPDFYGLWRVSEPTYVVNVQGIVVRGGELLLAERSADEEHAAGELAFPGGKVETPPGETDVLEQTVRRELREEVGVEVGDVEFLDSQTFELDSRSTCLNVLTRCEYEGGEARVNDPKEVAAVHWFTPEELAESDVPAYTVAHADLALA